MKLELLTNHPETIDVNKPPVLFVHGMWHGAWCWQPYFLPFFEKRGIKAYALSLSNHAGSPYKKPFNKLRISDYVDDVKNTIDSFDKKPVVVGHSMGGFIVQKYLENNILPGAVLMASVPPFGILGGTLATMKKFPGAFLKANATLNLKYIVDTDDKYKYLLFNNDFNNTEIKKYRQKTDTESYLAYLDMLLLNLVNVNTVKTPLLVLGGGKDRVISKNNILKTAGRYKAPVVIFKNTPHMMMLAPGYDKIAATIINWIEKL